jgi:hypothetical protein
MLRPSQDPYLCSLLESFFQAVFISLAFTWSGVSPGSFCRSRAAAPATMGAAMLVPFRRK